MISSSDKNGRVLGRILAEGELILKTPLIIGTGAGEDTDNDLLRGEDGRPFIPGTSWAGALRDYFSAISNKYVFERFFGSESMDDNNKEEYQSAFISSDLYLKGDKYSPEYRQNVRIDELTGTAEDGALFDYEVVPAGKSFSFRFEVVIRRDDSVDNEENFQTIKALGELSSAILFTLSNGQLLLGAKTNSGFGRIALQNIAYRYFDFAETNDRLDWFSGRHTLAEYHHQKENPFIVEIQNKYLEITGIFDIQDSMIIREYLENDDADQRHFHSNGKAIIPGSSLKGVLRHRAQMILKTMDMDYSKYIDELFGQVYEPENGQEAKAIKGRISVSEGIIDNEKESLQTRIRVDHFTGGAIDHALFAEKPIWNSGSSSVTFHLRVLNTNTDDTIHKLVLQDAALILQVLKDLWNGDLTVGGEAGIGRGILRGKLLQINFNGKQLIIANDNGKLAFQGNEELIEELDAIWQGFLQSHKEMNHVG